MLPGNILARTFFIKGLDYGSAFTVDVDGHEYLITARHLLDQTGTSTPIRLFLSEKWWDIPAEVVGHGHGEIDLSVLRLPHRLTHPELKVTPTIAGLTLGQDVFFLGFPYKLWSNLGKLLGGMPGAFVKKGTVSAYQMGDTQMIHLDAINNAGFSGGPVFFYSPSAPKEGRVAGVVSKFRVESERVVDEHGEPTGHTVPYNTGFLIAYGIQHALDIIERSRNRT